MEKELIGLLTLYGIGALGTLFQGIREVVIRRNPYGVVRRYYWLGVFVWGDAVVIGLFWLGAVICSAVLNDMKLFLLVVSVFWTIRCLGEVQYWMHEQFSPIMRNKPKDLWGNKWFAGESIWFVYQVFWQCMTVVFSMLTIYLIRSR